MTFCLPDSWTVLKQTYKPWEISKEEITIMVGLNISQEIIIWCFYVIDSYNAGQCSMVNPIRVYHSIIVHSFCSLSCFS